MIRVPLLAWVYQSYKTRQEIKEKISSETRKVVHTCRNTSAIVENAMIIVVYRLYIVWAKCSLVYRLDYSMD